MHLKIAYSICHWTYHLKMGEKLARSHPNPLVSDKYLPALLLNHGSSSSVGPTNQHLLSTASRPVTSKNMPLSTSGSTAAFFDDSRPKIVMASASTNSSGRGSGSSSRGGDLINSETMYRNEIRKSIRNVLQHKNLTSSAAAIAAAGNQNPNRNSCMANFSTGNNVNCVSNGVYGTGMPSMVTGAAPSVTTELDKNTFYYKPYNGTVASTGQPLMYKNARQIISDDHSGIYLTQANCLSASSPKNLNSEPIYQSYSGNNYMIHGGNGRLPNNPNSNSNTLTICSSKPSKFENSYKAPVLFLNRGPANEYESRV
jgi:hypothetical protein